MLEDRYYANRLLAFLALRKLEGVPSFDFDYIRMPDVRQPSVRKARDRCHQVAPDTAHSGIRDVLNVATDSEIENVLQQLIRDQNKTNVSILE